MTEGGQERGVGFVGFLEGPRFILPIVWPDSANAHGIRISCHACAADIPKRNERLRKRKEKEKG